jgi:PAS domain S-box-containing protein
MDAARRDAGRKFRELAILYELTSVLGESLDLDESLDALVDRLSRVVAADVVAVFLARPCDATLTGAPLRMAAGLARPRWPEARVPVGLAARLAAAPDEVLESDPAHPDPWLGALFPWLAGRLGRAIAVCLHTSARVLGVLVLARLDDAPFAAWTHRLLVRLCRRAALVVDHARVSEQLAHARLLTAVDNAADGIVITDAEGRIQYVNPAYELLTGYGRDDALGRSAPDLIRSDRHGQDHYDEIWSSLRSGRIWRGPLWCRRKDGTLVELETVLSPVFDERGAITSYVSVKRDVSEQRKLAARLAQADRLTSLGTLAAGMAHEINNPLTYLMGSLEYADQLLAAGPLDDATVAELREALRDAFDGAERVRHIVRGLKDFTHSAEGGPGAAHVRRAVDIAAKMVQGELRHRARFVVDCQPDILVGLREGALVQVLVNLLLNAAQAIAPGAAEENEIRVRCRGDGEGRVVISVWDTGEGMDEETLSRIFDPFFTTRRVGEGTGLGLSVCHGIVKAVGGEISAESQRGRGSSLTVALPSADPPPVELPSPETPVEQPRRARILLVDDEPLVGQMIRRVLRAHDVTVCTGGREGLAAWLTGGPFDLALCDLMMPDLTGMEFYRQTRQLAPGREDRILFITGGTFTPEAEAFVARLPRPPLEKPFSAPTLLACVRGMLDRAPEADVPAPEPLPSEDTGAAGW